MRKGRGRIAFAAALAAFLPALGPGASADVTVQERTSSEGGRDRARTGTETTATRVVSGNRMREDISARRSSPYLRRPGTGATEQATTIVRLDKGLVYRVDPRNRSYLEMSLEAGSAYFAESASRSTLPRRAYARGADPAMECDAVQLSTSRPGDKPTIGGFPTEHVVIAGTQSCRSTKGEQTCRNLVTLDLWTTPPTQALEELRSFERKWTAAMGLDARRPEALARAASGLPPRLSEELDETAAEVSKIAGYPIKIQAVVEREGNCAVRPPAEVQGASAGAAVPGHDAGAPAGSGAATPGAGTATPGSKRDAGEGVAGAHGGSATERQVPRAAVPAAGEGPAAKRTVMTLTTEIVSLSTAPAAADAFAPPEGFRKIEPPARRPAPAAPLVKIPEAAPGSEPATKKPESTPK